MVVDKLVNWDFCTLLVATSRSSFKTVSLRHIADLTSLKIVGHLQHQMNCSS